MRVVNTGAGRARSLRRVLVLSVLGVVAALGGLALSTWAGFSRTCLTTVAVAEPIPTESTCGAWTFAPWWGFWVSLAALAVCIAVSGVGVARQRRPRWLFAGVTMAAVALAPVPIELWRENELRRAIESLL